MGRFVKFDTMMVNTELYIDVDEIVTVVGNDNASSVIVSNGRQYDLNTGINETLALVNGETVKAIKKNRLMGMPLDELGLSVRTYNCLHRAGMSVVEDVVTAADNGRLIRVRNLGPTSYKEVTDKIAKLRGE